MSPTRARTAGRIADARGAGSSHQLAPQLSRWSLAGSPVSGRGIVMGTADPTRTVEALATAHALADLATRLRRQAEDWAARPVRPSR